MVNYVQLNSGLRQAGSTANGLLEQSNTQKRLGLAERQTDLQEEKFQEDVRRQRNAEAKNVYGNFTNEFLAHQQEARERGEEYSPDAYFQENPHMLDRLTEVSYGQEARARDLERVGGEEFAGFKRGEDGKYRPHYVSKEGEVKPFQGRSGEDLGVSGRDIMRGAAVRAMGNGLVNSYEAFKAMAPDNPEYPAARRQLKQEMTEVANQANMAPSEVMGIAESGELVSMIQDMAENTQSQAGSQADGGEQPQGGPVPTEQVDASRYEVDLLDEDPNASDATNAGRNTSNALRAGYNSAVAPGAAVRENQARAQMEGGRAMASGLRDFFGGLTGSKDEDAPAEAPAAGRNTQQSQPQGQQSGSGEPKLDGNFTRDQIPRLSEVVRNPNPKGAENPEEIQEQAEQVAEQARTPRQRQAVAAAGSRQMQGLYDDNSKEARATRAAIYANTQQLMGVKPDDKIVSNLLAGDDMRGSAMSYAALETELAKTRAENTSDEMKDLRKNNGEFFDDWAEGLHPRVENQGFSNPEDVKTNAILAYSNNLPALTRLGFPKDWREMDQVRRASFTRGIEDAMRMNGAVVGEWLGMFGGRELNTRGDISKSVMPPIVAGSMLINQFEDQPSIQQVVEAKGHKAAAEELGELYLNKVGATDYFEQREPQGE